LQFGCNNIVVDIGFGFGIGSGAKNDTVGLVTELLKTARAINKQEKCSLFRSIVQLIILLENNSGGM